MTSTEVKNILILAFIFATRMLGLFMVLPIFALYETKISGATASLLGLAIGIYGFTTALLQLPYGILSDYFGRRSIILCGLIIFAIGSLVASLSESIWGIILGRAIQGAGAIGSPILAFAADLTREAVRSRAMAIIGISIGLTFVLAILLGPILDALLGLNGIFLMTTVLALVGIGLLFCLEKEPSLLRHSPQPLRQQLQYVLLDKDLCALNMTIFVLHAILTASFLVLPLKIQEITSLLSNEVWKFYAPVLGLSLLFVMPLLRSADEHRSQKKRMNMAILGLGFCIIAFLAATTTTVLVVAVTLFFVGFNFLEANLPALISRIAPKTSKGTAMGVYSCAQFLGIFCGGAVGGLVLQHLGMIGIGLMCTLLTIMGWLSINHTNKLFKMA